MKYVLLYQTDILTETDYYHDMNFQQVIALSDKPTVKELKRKLQFLIDPIDFPDKEKIRFHSGCFVCDNDEYFKFKDFKPKFPDLVIGTCKGWCKKNPRKWKNVIDYLSKESISFQLVSTEFMETMTISVQKVRNCE